MNTLPAPESPSDKASRLFKEIQALWPAVADLTLRVAAQPAASVQLSRVLLRLSKLTEELNNAIAAMLGRSAIMDPVHVRFAAPGTPPKAVVEFGNLVSFKILVPVLQGELLAILGEATGAPSPSPSLADPAMPSPWVPAARLERRLREQTGRPLTRHHLQQIIYRLRSALGEYGYAELIESNRAKGYRIRARVIVIR